MKFAVSLLQIQLRAAIVRPLGQRKEHCPRFPCQLALATALSSVDDRRMMMSDEKTGSLQQATISFSSVQGLSVAPE
jgi:hypothetical protein